MKDYTSNYKSNYLQIIITKNMTIHIMIQITDIIIIKLEFPEVEEIIKEEEKKKMQNGIFII